MQVLPGGFDVSAATVAEGIESSGAACLEAALTGEWLRRPKSGSGLDFAAATSKRCGRGG